MRSAVLPAWIVMGACLLSAASAPAPVILISIDTLRADRLGVYGYRRAHTPHIDAFASHGTVFDAIDSQIPLTLPSHTSLLTSTYPFENGVEENDQRVPSAAVTLASVLRGHGYKTAAFIGSVLLDRSRGLDRGFDFYDSPFRGFSEETEREANPFASGVRRDGALVLRAARQWLGDHRGEPVFAFVHLFDLHTPYARSPDASGLPDSAGYDAEISYVDRLLGQFQQALARDGWWDRSLVVLLSDHGESLGDHGEWSHGYFIYPSTVRVPLIVHWPAAAQGFVPRTAQPGGLIDVAPSILDFLGLPAPSSFEGASLLAAARGGPPDGRAVYSESIYTRDAFGWAPLRAIRLSGFEYIDAPHAELYDLARDPGEWHNRLAENSGKARALHARLASLLARHSRGSTAASPASAQTRRALESLGYLGRGGAAGAPGKDPKQMLHEYLLFEKALSSMYAGSEDAAMATFRRLVASDRGNLLARYYLGEASLRAGRPDEAVREWTLALEFDPRYVPAAEALGACWMGREDYPKARAAFQKAVAAAPDDFPALLGLGMAEERMGLASEALKHLEAACRLAPDSASCRRELEAAKAKRK